ncbi:unnamed protein product, partial [Ectocarpus sp. 13 AM-2016]
RRATSSSVAPCSRWMLRGLRGSPKRGAGDHTQHGHRFFPTFGHTFGPDTAEARKASPEWSLLSDIVVLQKRPQRVGVARCHPNQRKVPGCSG